MNEIKEKIIADLKSYECECRISQDDDIICKRCNDNLFQAIYKIIERNFEKMTLDEAIKILKKARLAGIVDVDINRALDMAIKALEHQPCEDCISRQAAKLKVARVTWDDRDSRYDFHDKCVDCLDDLPPVTPQQKMSEGSDDVISREAVIKHVCESKECYKDECKGNLYKRCFDLQWIYGLPSVTPKPKRGHWIFDAILDKHYYCSECNSMGVDYWDYCPNCGAKMSEGSDEE